MKSNKMNQNLNKLTFAHYKNSTEVLPGLVMEDVIKACLVGRLNIYLIGETGEGKTQLENDIMSLFGNRRFFEQGRKDLTIKEIFMRLNLNSITERQALKQQMRYAWDSQRNEVTCMVPVLKKGQIVYAPDAQAVLAFKKLTSIGPEQLFELTRHIQSPIFVVDELTRCIPAVQNEFFNLFDGFITYNGYKIPLGCETLEITSPDGRKEKQKRISNADYKSIRDAGGNVRGAAYSIGVASGNTGNGRYVGTSEIDRALMDRMHLAIDVDTFYKTPNDTLDVLVSKKDPRVSETTGEDRTKIIMNLHKRLKMRRPTLLQYLAILHLVHGLDYYETDGDPQSKRANKNSWPGCVTGHDKGSDAALIFPFSTRSAISTLTLAKALEIVKEAKGDVYENGIDAVFDAAYLIGAQSGVLHPSAVDAHYDSKPYAAMQAVIDGTRQEFSAKEDATRQAIRWAQNGKVKYAQEFTGRWSYMQDVIERTARNATKARQ